LVSARPRRDDNVKPRDSGSVRPKSSPNNEICSLAIISSAAGIGLPRSSGAIYRFLFKPKRAARPESTDPFFLL
jgi:hypothetical protein